MRKLIFALIILFFTSVSHAATYNYYFSNAGSGSTCSEGSPCANLSDAQAKIDAAAQSDTVNLYFNKGDTWSYNSGAVGVKGTYGLTVDATNDPIVNIDAYGTGADPIFDGLVSDFSTANDHDATNGPTSWNNFFSFQRANCSMSNVEIKQVYGNGLSVQNADYFTLSDCTIHDFGSAGINGDSNTVIDNITVEDCTFYTGQELYRYGKRAGWEAAIQFTSRNYQPNNNVIRRCTVYDIYGEGINGPNATIEYCVVGDTGSIGINTSPHNWDSLTTIVRYNLIVMSDWSTSIYDNMSGSEPLGIRIFDERDSGTNANAIISIYGNIIINREMGIMFYVDDSDRDAFGLVKIYNNTIIDSRLWNIRISDQDGTNNGDNLADACYIYNNASILYDRVTATHVSDNGFLPHANYTIDNNAYWTTGGSPTVDSQWDDNYVTGDPKLPGEETEGIDWDGLTAYTDLDFDDDFYPPSDSSLYNSGATLGAGYDATLLIKTTNWDTGPGIDSPVTDETDNHSSNWEIGAVAMDYTAPTPSGQSPTGTVSCGPDPKSITEAFSTDEECTCKNNDADVAYGSMDAIDSTGGTSHSDTVSRACDATYTKYYRCSDPYGNTNDSSLTITYTVGQGEPPAEVDIPSSNLGGASSGGAIN